MAGNSLSVTAMASPPLILVCARNLRDGDAYEVPVYETDREHLRKVPPLYHMVYGWNKSPATKDEQGRLRFPQRFGLTRTQMVRMLAYLRSGVVVGNLEDLVETFVIFGGCHTPDTLLALQQERAGIVRMERDVAEIRRLQAPPKAPQNDTQDVYHWVGVSKQLAGNLAAPAGYDITGVWDGKYMWSRKKKTTTTA